MTQVISTQSVTALDIIRAEVVGDILRGYGASKKYAERLFEYFGDDWFAFEHNDKEEEAKPILEEAQKFRDALRAGGHTNPSVAWTRVRNEGAKMVHGDETPQGEGAEPAGAKVVRSLKLRMVEELSALHKAAKREEAKNNLGKAEAEAATFIASALKSLGVDLTMVQ